MSGEVPEITHNVESAEDLEIQRTNDVIDGVLIGLPKSQLPSADQLRALNRRILSGSNIYSGPYEKMNQAISQIAEQTIRGYMGWRSVSESPTLQFEDDPESQKAKLMYEKRRAGILGGLKRIVDTIYNVDKAQETTPFDQSTLVIDDNDGNSDY